MACNFNFQGAFAYLDWSYVFSKIHVTLLHADYVDYDNLRVYGRWGLALPTWIHELSVHVTDELAKYCVDFNGFATSFS